MSSVGQALGGLVGGVIGFMVGGPGGALYGAQLGIMAGGLVDPAKVQGPRLDDLSFQTSTYGTIIPRVYGTMAMNGNVFWLQGNSLTERSSTSSAKGGPEVTSYSYFATFAVGLCHGPIDGVRRIWIGGELWYDSAATDLDGVIVSNEHAQGFTLYLGTDTQTADPLIQADHTVADVPAYRGIAYIVFDSLPLEKYGNSLMGAQVKIEIIKDSTAQTITSIYSQNLPNDDALNTPGWMTPRTRDIENNILFRASGRLGGGPTDRVIYEFDIYQNPPLPTVYDYATYVVGYYNSDRHEAETDAHLYLVEQNYQYVELDGVQYLTGKSFTASSRDTYTVDTGTSLWVSMTEVSGSAAIIVVIDKIPFESKGVVLTTLTMTTKDYRHTYDADNDRVIVLFSDRIEKYIPNTGVLDETVTFGASISNITAISCDNDVLWNFYNLGTTYLLKGYSLDDGVLLYSYSYNESLNASGDLKGYVHNGMLVTLIEAGTTSASRLIRLLKLPLLDSALVTLGDIVEAECLTSNLLESTDLDVTELTDQVRGYRVSQLGAIRNAIEPLRAVWPFDVVQHGYDIQFKKRGSASVATISADELDARPAGQAPGVEISDSREMDLQLPQKVSIKYLDAVREYDINEQSEERANTDAVNHATIELPVVMNADEAKQTASMLLYLMWLERYDVAFSLPPEYLELEPGDVITVNADNATYQLRLTSVNATADSRLECKAKYDSAAVYVQTGAVGEEGQSTGGSLALAGPTELVLLDIPLLRDDDNTAGFPVAMGGYTTAWPGGTLYRSEDEGQSWADLVASVSPGAVIGYASTSLSAHGGTMLDKASTLTVWLYSGELASVTEAQMFAGANWFAYGTHGRWEIIAAQVATLQGDGSYILRDFLRGQKGTEWATGLHAANDRLILLDESALNFVSVNSSSIGSEKLYRGITFGKALDSATDTVFTYAGVNLECLNPINLTGSRHPSTNDWTLEWTRRSRYGDWRDFVDAPLGEASQSYEVDVFSSVTYATLKRTLTSATPTVAYTSAQQVTDFGSNQGTLYLKIYQLSATVGRGYPLTASITR